ncbi:MAG: class I tRNA ligase family protein, partial [Candidatus Omnitrophota bacterium]
TVDPDEVLSKYGADTLRLFILFAAPPEDQLEWNSDGLEGAWRFLNRVYQMVEKRYVQEPINQAADQDLERERNHAIKRVSQNFEEGFKFNTAISHMMVLSNAIDKHKTESSKVLNSAIETLVLLLAPFAPHLCEELWQMMGKDTKTISKVAWPAFDEKALVQNEVNYAVQINGKIRGQFTASVTATQEQLRELCMKDANVMRYLEGATIKKFIVVPNKLVSIVV